MEIQYYREKTPANRGYGAAGTLDFVPVTSDQARRLREKGEPLYTWEQIQAMRNSGASAATGAPAAPGLMAPIRLATAPRGGRRKTRRVTKKRKTMKRKHYRK